MTIDSFSELRIMIIRYFHEMKILFILLNPYLKAKFVPGKG